MITEAIYTLAQFWNVDTIDGARRSGYCARSVKRRHQCFLTGPLTGDFLGHIEVTRDWIDPGKRVGRINNGSILDRHIHIKFTQTAKTSGNRHITAKQLPGEIVNGDGTVF